MARTGYTGEDGFEIFVAPTDAPALWRRIVAAGAPHGLLPAGLGARDTLRLEARMMLYGNDMDETTTLIEAGLGWIVSLDEAKGDFSGRAVLAEQKANGAPRKLVGFEMAERGIPRHGYPVLLGGAAVGRRHLRDVRAVPAEEHRPVLPARGARGRRDGARGRDPGPPRRRRASCRHRSTSVRGRNRERTEEATAMYPQEYRYSKDHEWILVEGERGRVGITDYAQKQLGDVVFLELPEVGRTLEGRRAVRDRRVGEGGLRAVLARRRRGRRGQRGPRRQARGDQQGPARRGLDDRGCGSPTRPASAR